MLRLNILKITSPTEDPNVVYEYDELFQKYDLMNEKEISEPKNCALKEMAIPFNVNYNAYDLEKVREILGFKNKIDILSINEKVTVFTDGIITKSVRNSRLQKYATQKTGIFWVFGRECVGCWFGGAQKFRKNIVEKLKNDGIPVEEDGYYKLTTSQVHNVVAETHCYLDMLKATDEDLYVYNETQE